MSPRRSTLAIALILFASILLKLAFIWYLDGRAYPDVFRAINFGYRLHQDIFSIHTEIINSKTFLGPILWFHLYQSFGMLGLNLLNIFVFVLLFFTQYALGKGRYGTSTIVFALFIFAFYVGTNRNVVAGEPDDNIAALCFSLGLLVYLNTGRLFSSSFLMGVGFLFKFWVAVFCVGFAFYLLSKVRLRDLCLAGLGMSLPFLLINGIDGFASMRALLKSVGIQHRYSDWGEVGFKMLSTGMTFSVLASAWMWLKRRSDPNTLFFLVSSAYFVYVLVNRDAFAASFVMMQCLMFSSFLIAELALTAQSLRNDRWRAGALMVSCAIYLVITSAITYQHLYRDTAADPRRNSVGDQKDVLAPEVMI